MSNVYILVVFDDELEFLKLIFLGQELLFIVFLLLVDFLTMGWTWFEFLFRVEILEFFIGALLIWYDFILFLFYLLFLFVITVVSIMQWKFVSCVLVFFKFFSKISIFLFFIYDPPFKIKPSSVLYLFRFIRIGVFQKIFL